MTVGHRILIASCSAVILFGAFAFRVIGARHRESRGREPYSVSRMETELHGADNSECQVLTQLGDTVTTKLLFLDGSPVQEDITIEGPAELIPIQRGPQSTLV